MRRRYLIGLALLMSLGCGPKHESGDMTMIDRETGQQEPVPPELQGAFRDTARQQAKGLQGATAKVNGAYNYTGFSYLKPVEQAKLVSVDVEFSGYSASFDLDDVDVIDGGTEENFGSDPHIALLSKDGAVMPESAEWPKAPGPVRVLLIYALPKQARSLKLGYWGAVITEKSINLADGGPKLSEPAKQ